MAQKKNLQKQNRVPAMKGIIEGAGEVVEQPIVSTIEKVQFLCPETAVGFSFLLFSHVFIPLFYGESSCLLN